MNLREIRIHPDSTLFSMITDSAQYMQISREELVLKILKFWQKNNTLPLEHTDRLCTILPEKDPNHDDP